MIITDLTTKSARKKSFHKEKSVFRQDRLFEILYQFHNNSILLDCVMNLALNGLFQEVYFMVILKPCFVKEYLAISIASDLFTSFF